MEFKFLQKKCPWRNRMLLSGGRKFVCCASNKVCEPESCAPWHFALRSLQLTDDSLAEMITRINKKQDKT